MGCKKLYFLLPRVNDVPTGRFSGEENKLRRLSQTAILSNLPKSH